MDLETLKAEDGLGKLIEYLDSQLAKDDLAESSSWKSLNVSQDMAQQSLFLNLTAHTIK